MSSAKASRDSYLRLAVKIKPMILLPLRSPLDKEENKNVFLSSDAPIDKRIMPMPNTF